MIKEAAGKKYLCKCIDNKNHIDYRGSGVKWRQFLKDNNIENVNTQVLGHYTCKQELKDAGIHYSEKYNVVESEKWLYARSAEGRQKLIDLHTGRKRSDETRANMRNATRRKRVTVECEYCNRSLTPQNIARHKLKCKV